MGKSDKNNKFSTEYIDLDMDEFEARKEIRAARREAMKKRKKMQVLMRRVMIVVLPLLLTGVIVCIVQIAQKTKALRAEKDRSEQSETITDAIVEETPKKEIIDTTHVEDISLLDENGYGLYANDFSEEKNIFFEGYEVNGMAGASYPSEDDVISKYALLIDAKTGKVIAARDAELRINPASMTKIMTILVASERIANPKDKVMIDQEITDYVWKNDCSAVNFSLNETVTVEDVMYGTILPSGADAALALAKYVAGSEEAFVELMNDKLDELGLSDTAHFTNCTGIYNQNHYCTLVDMAMIMKAAVENEEAKKILMTHTYTTSSTEEHSDGISISNWFLRRIEDKDTHGEVLCAKTGFVNESGCCAASYMKSDKGGYYICVTADAWSSWRCIYDHVALYETYAD